MTVETSFGRWLQRRRKALDLTQEELAQRVGCAAETLRKIEADVRRPSRPMAESLAAALEIPVPDRAVFIKAARAELAVDRLNAPTQDLPQVALVPTKTLSSEAVTFLFTQITPAGQTKSFDGRCPYKGLSAFEEEDAGLFFGREQVVSDLLRRVEESQAVFVIGPSGSGKSSLIRAGLIPVLKQGGAESLHSERWLYETIKPGRDPIGELARVTSSMARTTNAGGEIRMNAAENPSIFSEWCEIALKEGREKRAFIFIDQFEEIFTQVSDEEERLMFLSMLTRAATAEHGRVILLFAMRSDFVSNCAAYPQLNSLFNQQSMQIGAMEIDELVRAIAQPAVNVGLPIDRELVQQIIEDMQGEPGALPLLQFALKDLFDSQQAKGGVMILTLPDYLQHGGIHKSLQRHADSAFAKLHDHEQEVARFVFSRLIEVGRGTQDTRRTSLLSEIIPSGSSTAEVELVVQKLVDARLVTVDEQSGVDLVTISHEKLIDAWPWLKKLVDENRDIIALQNEIAQDAKEWHASNRDVSYLYSGVRLTSAYEDLKAKKLVLSGVAYDFLQAGQARKQRSRVALIAGISAIIFLLFAAVLVFRDQSTRSASIASTAQAESQARATQQSIAESNFQQAESQRLGAEGLALAESPGGNAEIAALLGIRGLHTVYSPQADAALQQALPGLSAKRVLRQNPRIIVDLALSPDGKTFFTSDMRLRDVVSAVVTYDLLGLSRESWGLDVTFSPDGTRALSGHFDNIARLWDVQTGELLQTFNGHTDFVSGVAFSPDGKWVLTASYDKTARLWDAATGQEVRAFRGHTGPVESVAFSPDGTQVLTGGSDQTARLWDVSSGQTVRIFQGQIPNVSAIAFSPDGREILTGSSDSTVILWDAATGQELRQFEGHKDLVRSVSFSSDSKWVLTASADNTARLWNADTGEMLRVFSGHTDVVGSAVFAPDGQSIYTGSLDRTIRQWKLGPDERVFTLPYPDGYGVFSTDGQSIYLLSYEGELAWLLDARSGRELARFRGHGDAIASMHISNDTKYVLTGSFDNTARLWDARTGQELRIFRGQTGHVDAIFSPDGKFVLTIGEDKTVRVWETVTGQLVQAFNFDIFIDTAAISPDNKYILTTHAATFDFMMWDIQSGKLIHYFDLVSSLSGATSLDISPDGKYLLTGLQGGEMNNTIALWDASTYELVRTFAHPDTVVGRFSSNGQFIWTSSADGKVRQWDVNTGQLVRVFTGPRGYGSVETSPDGKFVLISYPDQTVHLYDVDYHDTIRYACSRLVRDLTLDERKVYDIKDNKPTCP